MGFDSLTAAEAEAHRAAVEADGPARLTALAALLISDGEPLDEFDGTPQSLVPLWSWFVAFARSDFPGIASDSDPRSYSIEPWSPEDSRLYYASEMFEDYLVEVAATCFADLAWVVNPNKGFEGFQRPMLQYWDDGGHPHFADPQRHVAGAVRRALRGDAQAGADTYQAARFFRGTFLSPPSTAERALSLGRGASILAPLAEGSGIDHLPYQRMQAREPVYSRTAVPTLQVMKQQKAAADAEPAGDELILAHTAAIVESLDQALALDAMVISDTLNMLGFRSSSGELLTAESILAEASADYLLGDDAMATTLVLGGELRAVQLASISTTKKTWTKLTKAFEKAGRTMGAKLAREDEFMPEDES